MASIVLTKAAQGRILEDMLTAVTGMLVTNTVKLFQSDSPADEDFDPTDPSVIEADFSGYAAKAVTYFALSVSDDGSFEVVGRVAEFRHNGGGTENDVFGGWLLNAAGDILGSFRLDEENGNQPIPFHSAVDSAALTVRIRVRGSGLIVNVS